MIVTSSSSTQFITWDAPKDNGSPIINYDAEVIISNGTDWFAACSTNETSCLVKGLLPYNYYSYRVHAWNKMGRSGPSAASKPDTTLIGGETL